MAWAAFALLSTAVVLIVPGVLVASLLRMRLGMLATWAAVPAFSLGAVFLLAEFTNLTGVPFGVPAFVVLVALLGGGVLVLRLRRSHGFGDDGNADPETRRRVRPDLTHWVAYGLLVLGIAIGAFTWARGLDDGVLVPPASDGANHGFMVGRILDSHSAKVSNVVVSDPHGAHAAADYYPLAMHASAAIATRLANADIGRMLIVFAVVFASVVFPLGMFVLARFLAPGRPLVAGFTAVVAPALTIFPYAPMNSGDVPQLVGMAMIPVSVVVVTRAVTGSGLPLEFSRRFVLALLPAALVLLTALSLHSSQLPLIIFLVVLLVLERTWHDHAPELLLRALVRGLAVVLLTMVLFAPTILQFSGGVSERSSIVKGQVVNLEAAIGPILTLAAPARQGFLVLLALLGAGLWLMQRRPAWVVGYASVIGLTLLATVSTGTLSKALSFPWYRQAVRILWNQGFFIAFFAAVVLAFAVGGVARLFRSQWSILPATVGALAIFTVFSGVDAYHANRSLLQVKFSANQLSNQRVSGSSFAAFAWLDQHARRRDTVVRDNAFDGSLWMYAKYGLNPLLGMEPLGCSNLGATCSSDVSSDYKDRIYVIYHLSSLGQEPRVDRLARRYNARWVYIDERTFGEVRTLQLEALRRNPHITEVFHLNTVHVLKINDF